jgi:uncharacterized protein (TIGR03437 family)
MVTATYRFRFAALLVGVVLAQSLSAQRAIAPLPLNEKNYRAHAGDGVKLDAPAETVAFVSAASKRSATPPFVFTSNEDASGLLLTASLRTPPGRYAVTVSATREDGASMQSTLSVVIDPVKTVPSNATKPPVVLLNGFQLAFGPCQPSNTTPHSKTTFGSLETQLLGDGVPVVYFFDNCVEAPDAKIEDLGNALAQFMNLIKDDTGAQVQQIDLVGHSMGGLIARSYLAGLQSDGSLAPPANPRVRKLLLIAAPNFGSFIAAEFGALLGGQVTEMEPGSPFLWNLNRWNQFTDDLRGVDSLAIVGNAGPLSNQNNASDGVVSLTSGSLGFVRDVSHTRILPYCHTDGLAVAGCFVGAIANADAAPETAQIVRSYLSGTSAWSVIGGTPDKDQYLSQNGAVYFAAENAAGTQYLNDLSQVAWGSAPLQSVSGASVFYNELVKNGTNAFTGTSTSAGKINCGAVTVPAGFYSMFRCKPSATITSVGPLATIVCVTTPCPQTTAKLVLPGAGGAITITGAGFGAQRCASCGVTANPGGVALQISGWTDTSIVAQLPPSVGAGLVQLIVQAAGGADSINIVIPAVTGGIGPIVTSLTNAASGASGAIAPGELVTIKGVGLGPSTAVQFSVDPSTGKVATTLAGVQVLIGGIAAPITYASSMQINAIVPYELAGLQARPSVTVQYNGTSLPLAVSIATAAPGAFTFNSTGAGQAVAANQDGSFNGPASPALKGSYVTIYFTGGGQTMPAGATGSVNSTTMLKQFQNVSATVGGQPVAVAFAGAAPGLVDGVCQLNIQLPANIATGDALPLVITVGGVASVSTATLAVQ